MSGERTGSWPGYRKLRKRTRQRWRQLRDDPAAWRGFLVLWGWAVIAAAAGLAIAIGLGVR
jgi:hypothetical protein